MVSPISVVSNELARLVPFFVTVCIYMIVSLVSSKPVWLKGLTKILPIICLCVFVLSNGKKFLCSHHSVLKLLAGLILSAMGDVLLLKDDNKIFIIGGAMFALAHCLYTWAFGFKPLNLRAGCLMAVVVVLGLTFLSTCLMTWEVLLLACYCILIGIMSWRANAEVLFHNQRPATKVICGIGAAVFMVSDFTLATNLLCFPVPYESVIVMTTYYMAQLFITLGIVKGNKKISD
ncbi:lysoplasmalogenase TMEM86A-like [Heptranchias perlo]|uniref:lysoplasmalogenase TMEM86A-like n=1 Tax=Heptranchias perlo TaxID=212740 RepID=UPI00355A8859